MISPSSRVICGPEDVERSLDVDLKLSPEAVDDGREVPRVEVVG